jgi:serine/threonine protein phosphatase PrpC
MFIEQTNLIRTTAGSRKNRYPDKPYEDAFWAGPASRVFCVADGITRSRGVDGSYPNPSPASDVARLVVSALASRLDHRNAASKTEPTILEALRMANRDVYDYVQGQQENGEFFKDDIPGAVATILAFEGNSAMFVHLGDCAVLFFPQGDPSRPTRLTMDQTAGARKWLTETTSIPWEMRMEFVRRSVRNVPDHPFAFGVLCGDPKAFEFIQTGRIRATSGDLFLLCTDGLEAAIANLPQDSRLQKLIALRDVEGILDYAERLDQTLQRRSDDKTLLFVDVLKSK